MRIERIEVARGHIYKIYRSGDDFIELMRRLIPLLRGSGCDVWIGGTDDDPDVIITVGLLDAQTEQLFERRIGRST